MIRDSLLGILREVDVVAEFQNEGETWRQCYEVTTQAGPVDITWAEQMIAKHKNLGTDRLYLVPWNGATEAAQALINQTNDTFLIVPQVVQGNDGPEIKNLFVDMVYIGPQRVVATVELPEGGSGTVLLEQDFVLCSKDGEFRGTARDLCDMIVQDPEAIRRLLVGAHSHPERDAIESFTLSANYGSLELYLRHENPTAYHHITNVEIAGEFNFDQAPLDLEVRNWLEQPFAHGRTQLSELDALVVALLNEQDEVTQIRVQVKPREDTPTA